MNESEFIPSQNSVSFVGEAKDVLRGKQLPLSEMVILAEKLKTEKAFGYARRILARAADNSEIDQDNKLKVKIYQQWTLCTYKDSDLPTDARLDEALGILQIVENFETTKNQETLGLIGAIYKRKWEVDNQKLQLEKSLFYYERGYQEGPVGDQGYSGINAAFTLDLLAHQEEDVAKEANAGSVIAQERRDEARRIREELLEKLPPLMHETATSRLGSMWWYYATIAESYFGLQRYDEAVQCLKSARDNVESISEWEEESTIRQLARLAILQSDSGLSGDEFQNSPAWKALQELFGKDPTPVRTAFIGKIGLALSGGGFRASLFHIGTLAKLAELDVLRHIEVLSCVSGGSIIGAHYYLELRKLLQSKSDEEITTQDYIDIIHRIEKDFLEGVQCNLRMRVVAEIQINLKMIFSSNYSRTMRIGELYEKEIFSRINDEEGAFPRFLSKLNIVPKGKSCKFESKNNWHRAAKIPSLILNATSLNTGHNWQFTTTHMGEPPSSIDTEIDINEQLRRMSYAEAPDAHKQIRLGYAVSASACVPGLFEPLALENLYPNRIIRLVDGGVCDNQGISGLLEQDCTVILVSDGSGQMESENYPSNGLLGVPLRSNSILQARIRDTQYHDLERRKRSSLLRGLMFTHLKRDLDIDPIDWIGCLDPFASSIEARPPSRSGILTSYGIAKEIQKRLAAIRTDLDSFSDLEASALMTSAYRMTEDTFLNSECVEGFSKEKISIPWKFLDIEDAMKGEGEKFSRLNKLLSVSNNIAFKTWRQYPLLKILAMFLVGVIAFTIALIYTHLPDLIILKKWFVSLIFISVFAYILGSIFKIFRWNRTPLGIIIGIGISLIWWMIAQVHLHVFDRLFLVRGKIESLNQKN